MIGFALLVLPGLLISLVVAFGCLYVLPLMTDRGLGLVEAVKESFRMSTGKSTLDQVVVMVLYLGLSAVGGSVFIGWLFTQPFATIFLLSVYEEKVSRPQPS
jgi:membrane-anchored glycerophosphoryl diester phosphodiesterase (GDPDase)